YSASPGTQSLRLGSGGLRRRLEAGAGGIALGAEPALAAGGDHPAAVVVGRPGHQVDLLPAGDGALDRATFGRALLGLVPGLCGPLGRPHAVADGPDAVLGGARLLLLAAVARHHEAALGEGHALAHHLGIDLLVTARAAHERRAVAVAAVARAGNLRAAEDA